jgi:hypothetical protein
MGSYGVKPELLTKASFSTFTHFSSRPFWVKKCSFPTHYCSPLNAHLGAPKPLGDGGFSLFIHSVALLSKLSALRSLLTAHLGTPTCHAEASAGVG